MTPDSDLLRDILALATQHGYVEVEHGPLTDWLAAELAIGAHARIGKWQHRPFDCRVCGEPHLHRRPIDNSAPWQAGEYQQSEAGSTWVVLHAEKAEAAPKAGLAPRSLDDAGGGAQHSAPNLAVTAVRAPEQAAGEHGSGNGAAALPGWRRDPGDDDDGGNYGPYYVHASGARIFEDKRVRGWIVYLGGARYSTAAQAAAAALGYVITKDAARLWSWSGPVTNPATCGWSSAELAALDALLHHERAYKTPAPTAVHAAADQARDTVGSERAGGEQTRTSTPVALPPGFRELPERFCGRPRYTCRKDGDAGFGVVSWHGPEWAAWGPCYDAPFRGDDLEAACRDAWDSCPPDERVDLPIESIASKLRPGWRVLEGTKHNGREVITCRRDNNSPRFGTVYWHSDSVSSGWCDGCGNVFGDDVNAAMRSAELRCPKREREPECVGDDLEQAFDEAERRARYWSPFRRDEAALAIRRALNLRVERVGLPERACTCGSGAHPRRCAQHPERFDQHSAQLSAEIVAEGLREEAAILRAQVRQLRDALEFARLERDEAREALTEEREERKRGGDDGE